MTPTEASDSKTETLENRAFLSELSVAKMPFGKYEGTLLIDLPEAYIIWFARNGFPEGKLGRMMAIIHEIKINGLEYLLRSDTSRQNQTACIDPMELKRT
jgi:hypothetical protein